MNASKIAYAAVLACAASSQTALAAPTVTSIIDLGRLSADASEKTYAYNVNASGLISGRSALGANNTAFTGSMGSGALTALASNVVVGTTSYTSYQANASNAAGITVGAAARSAAGLNTGSGAVALKWSGGVANVLNMGNDVTPASANSQMMGRALDINDAGTIVGQVGSSIYSRGQIWAADGTAMNMPTASNGTVVKVATGINDRGIVIGEGWADGKTDGTAVRKAAIVYDPFWGTTTELLPNLAGVTANGALANDISNGGFVTGQLFNGSAATGSFLWKSGVMSLIPQLAGTSSFIATGVNSFGWVVGTAMAGTKLTPWVFDGSATYSLSSLLPADSGVSFLGTSSTQSVLGLSINDAGVVVGSMASFNGSTTVGHAFALTIPDAAIAAVPEPQSYALLLSGLALLGWVARRRTGLNDA